MGWTDKVARETIIKLRKEFHIQTAIETGTYKGVNAEWLSRHFSYVITIENVEEYYNRAIQRLMSFSNCKVHFGDSSFFLSLDYRKIRAYHCPLFYLDAHFYDPLQKQKWVVVDELKALQGFGKCIICIHDFDNGEFGHLTYDGQSLNWDVIGEHIQKVNPNFSYYTNTECDIYTEDTIEGVTLDDVVLDNLRTFKGRDRRGLLYAVPKPLDLSKYKLREVY